MNPQPNDDAPRGASALDYAKAAYQYLYPHHPLSALMHRLTRLRGGAVSTWAIRRFIGLFGVDMGEAAEPDPGAYSHFNAFFTRALREGARPLPADPSAVVSPADGVLSQAGRLDGGRILQAKGRHFSAQTLLGGDAARAAPFTGGVFATVYLSPRDYHRVHMPFGGRLLEMHYVPGRLFSVSPATTRAVPGLFARNERVVSLFETDLGPMAVVLVGAIFVGSIETVWAGAVTPRRPRHPRSWRYAGPDAPVLARGAEMGRFNMGSTVIVLLPDSGVRWLDSLRPGRHLRMGQAIGTFAAR